MDGRRTALVVTVPQAEAAVGELRLALDPYARVGVPAHVTVLYPFVPAAGLDDEVLTRTMEAVRSEPAFAFSLVRTDWFADDVLWLAPDEASRFRSLTGRVWRAFPEHPPYEGRFDDVVPHLTVGSDAPSEALRHAEQSVQSHLPIKGYAGSVTLLVEQPSGRWEVASAFALAPPS